MKNIRFFSVVLMILFFLGLFLKDNASLANSQCNFYRDLYYTILKSGKPSEINQARDLMNKFCNDSYSITVPPNALKPGTKTLPGQSPSFTPCPYVRKPYCLNGTNPLTFYDNKGCVSYSCPSSLPPGGVYFSKDKSNTNSQNGSGGGYRTGTRICPTLLKPSNCPSSDVVPIMKDGCIVRYFCRQKQNQGNCPAINQTINCPTHQKAIYARDSKGCLYLTCR